MNQIILKRLISTKYNLVPIGLSSVSAKFQPVVSHLHTEINVTSSTSSLNAAKLYSTLNAKDDENLKAQQEKVISLNRFLITNPYTIFVKENIKILKKKTPEISNQEAIKLIAQEWNSLSKEQKLVYSLSADNNRQEKKKILEDLFSSMTLEDGKAVKNSLRKIHAKRIEKRKSIKRRREIKAFNKPKRPKTAFVLYCQTLDRGEAGTKEFILAASQKWKIIPEQEKKKFIEEAKNLYEKFNKDIAEWEAKMLTMGKANLIRRKIRDKLMKSLTAYQDMGNTKKAKLQKKRESNQLKKYKASLRKLSNTAGKVYKKTKKIFSEVDQNIEKIKQDTSEKDASETQKVVENKID